MLHLDSGGKAEAQHRYRCTRVEVCRRITSPDPVLRRNRRTVRRDAVHPARRPGQTSRTRRDHRRREATGSGTQGDQGAPATSSGEPAPAQDLVVGCVGRSREKSRRPGQEAGCGSRRGAGARHRSRRIGIARAHRFEAARSVERPDAAACRRGGGRAPGSCGRYRGFG